MKARALVACALCACWIVAPACGTDEAVGDAGGVGEADAGPDRTPDAGTDAGGEDSGPPRFDAGPPPDECAVSPPLELGRCRDASDGPCDGSDGEAPVFEEMPADGSIDMVVGPQGATMFVMAARTTGIDPGDPDAAYSADNPLVEITLTSEEDELLSLFRSRAAFREDGVEPDTYYNASLFVIVDARGGELAGQTMHADAVLRDADGEVRCGSLAFVAGGL